MDCRNHGKLFARACLWLAVLLFPAAWFLIGQICIVFIQPHTALPDAIFWIASLIAGLAVAFPLVGLGLFLRTVIDRNTAKPPASGQDDLTEEEKKKLADEFFPHLKPAVGKG